MGQDLTTMSDEELVSAYGNAMFDICACDEVGDDKGLQEAGQQKDAAYAELLRRLRGRVPIVDDDLAERLRYAPGALVLSKDYYTGIDGPDWDESDRIRSDSEQHRPFVRCLGCDRLFQPTDIRICDPHDDSIHRCVECHAAKFGTLPEWAKPPPGQPCHVCGRGVCSEGAD